MRKKSVDIFIIDDDDSLREMLSLHFDDMNLSSMNFGTGKRGLNALSEFQPKLILLDQHLPDTLGLSLIPQIIGLYPNTQIVMMTGKHDMQLAISAIKAGAIEYIHKPIDIEELEKITVKYTANFRPKKSNISEDNNPSYNDNDIIGTSKGIINVVKNIAVASTGKATVLIQGETGTGKELVARAIHKNSGRTGPFLAVNCGAIVETLLESEMFGHEKGAFTGAEQSKDGKFTLAQDGTLFLDEIGEMSPKLQTKLLRVLQDRSFDKVGGSKTLHTNTHVIAATHRNLEQMIAEGTFREDLYYRLKIMSIHIPPLRDRMEDIPQLSKYLIKKIAKEQNKDIKGLTDLSMLKLNDYHWPGNVRELENVLTRAVTLSRTGVIDAEHLVFGQSLHTQSPTHVQIASEATQTLEEVERGYILRVLESTNGHKGKACEILGISRPALTRKIKKFNIPE